MSHDIQSEFEDRVRTLYRRTSADIDTATASRLRQARQRALEAAERPDLRRWLVPTGALAACVLAVAVIWPFHARNAQQAATLPVASHSVASTDPYLPPDPEQTDPTMYQNLDFYAWLADQSAAASPSHRGG